MPSIPDDYQREMGEEEKQDEHKPTKKSKKNKVCKSCLLLQRNRLVLLSLDKRTSKIFRTVQQNSNNFDLKILSDPSLSSAGVC